MGLNLHNKNLDFLFKAVLALENVEECYDFFEDLCTVQELNAISQRIVVAKMLSEKCVYTDIVNETGASTATISRVNRSMFTCVVIRSEMQSIIHRTGSIMPCA